MKKTKFSLPVSPWCSVLLIVASLVCLAVLLALPLVVRFGRSAAQILQNEPRQQGLMAGSLWWSVSAAQQPKSPKTDLAMLVCLAELLALPLVVRFGRSAAQILQNGPRQLGLLGCAPCSLSLVVRFGRSAAQILQNGPLGSLLSLWCSVLAAQRPKSSKTDLASLVCLAVLLLSLWWSVLAAQQPKSSKTDLAMLVCWAVLLALPLAVRFGRSAAQILQKGPPQLFH